MYCPECGNDAGEAKFCPECGLQLDGVRSAVRGGPPTTDAARVGDGGGGAGRGRPAPPQSHQRRDPRGIHPLYLWLGVAAVAAVVLVVAWRSSGGGGGTTGAASPSATMSLPPPVADTKGAYRVLVDRANTLFDHGQAVLDAGQQGYSGQATPYFAAAAKVYAAAWKKKSTDPNVATDWSWAIFESGDVDGAIARADQVIARFPAFQPAYHHRGIFLVMKANARGTDTDEGRQLLDQARAALDKAVSLDPSSPFGQEAAQYLQQL